MYMYIYIYIGLTSFDFSISANTSIIEQTTLQEPRLALRNIVCEAVML